MSDTTPINELEANNKFNKIIAKITHLDEKQTSSTGKALQEGIIEDDTGQVKITLWGEEADKFKVGESITLLNGWCKEYEGELQVQSGQYNKVKPSTSIDSKRSVRVEIRFLSEAMEESMKQNDHLKGDTYKQMSEEELKTLMYKVVEITKDETVQAKTWINIANYCMMIYWNNKQRK